jgi:hypothetical protein
MRFLKQFWTIFEGFFPKTSVQESSHTIDKNEPLSRYLTSTNHFGRQNNRVKYSAFMPPADLKLSVFRTKELPEKAIWDIGNNEVGENAQVPKTLYGRAEITPLVVKKVELSIDPDDEPPRHANIIGWPQEKSEQKLKALELAESATLKLRL